ncbi:MAG: plasminogen-binding N-terminal domain-containing protein [Sulfurospirillaceae bacterium]|nr:plasminogen-binding N-terminal domain-containing protein [Sulfurospirillaceae bacterium]MDD3463731.1 plasminogen-binding N-terminal domain-containing protein [Sulfurospirillaceae bacterium]
MRRPIAVVLVFVLSTFLNAKSLFSEYKTKILEVSEKNAIIEDSSDIFIGSSGIVIHKIDNTTSTIVARVDVISKSNGKAILQFEVFDMLAQKAFPVSGVRPNVGDEVIINYLYDRALIVAPNYEVYNEITKHYNTITWVHPDIVAGYLLKEYRPNPDREIFKLTCTQNAASLIFFALNHRGYFVDCNNFRVIKEVQAGEVKDAQLPFYARLKGIESAWLSFDSADIKDYNTHYNSLIRK